MHQKLIISIIGGDTRQIYLLLKFMEAGYSCMSYGLPAKELEMLLSLPSALNAPGSHTAASSVPEALKHSNLILGPIPLSKDGLINSAEKIEISDLLTLMQKDQYLFAGCITDTVKESLEKKGVHCFDYMKSEDLTLFNSIATAEGMIAEAIGQYPRNLHKSRCLVIGYGRCGKTLADKLKGIGAEVSVCARRKDSLSAAYTLGYSGFEFTDLASHIFAYDLIFNTVPAAVLSDDLLEAANPKCYIFDLASKPGGLDHAAARKLGLHAGMYLGLPGRYAPAASADGLYEYIERIVL